jgi:hypothetical protein
LLDRQAAMRAEGDAPLSLLAVTVLHDVDQAAARTHAAKVSIEAQIDSAIEAFNSAHNELLAIPEGGT